MLASHSGGAALSAPLRAAGARTRSVRARYAPTTAAKSPAVSERVATALRGTAVFVVGDNSAANAKLCDTLAVTLGCARQRLRRSAALTPWRAAMCRCTPSSCSAASRASR